MATVQIPHPEEQHVVLHVSWDGYVAIGEAVRDQPIRMTFDRGRLEIMTTSHEHEWLKKLVARLLETLVVELDIEMASGGSMTFQLELLEKGVEPDECYWIQHEPQMRGKEDYDPDTDPPPDLAVEVEISRSILDRLGIYAALKIPEVWRYDGKAMQVLLLRESGEYQSSPTSKALPPVPIADLAAFLDLRTTLSETRLVRRFRDWVRENAANWSTKKRRGRMK